MSYSPKEGQRIRKKKQDEDTVPKVIESSRKVKNLKNDESLQKLNTITVS